MTAKEPKVDVEKIKFAVQNEIPITLTTHTMPREIELYMEAVLDVFLAEIGQAKLKEYLIYCLRELAVNAKKANTKRVYFDTRGLNINDPNHYQTGMETFKTDTLENINFYLQKQKEQQYYIKIIFQLQNKNVNIEVRNNSIMTRTEFLRVKERLANARKFESLEDAMSKVLDSTEGAGLGLVILSLMLKKIGLDDDCFSINIENNETVSKIKVPTDKIQLENMELLTQKIIQSISSLPRFPENVLNIQRLIADPKSEMADIAKSISTDPSMTADLLKFINSAHFMLQRKVNNLTEAVKLVGMRGIKNLLFSYGTQKIFADEHGAVEQKTLWEHSYKCAYYSYNIAKNFKSGNKALQDDAYVAGMLHDMGKILFSAIHPDLVDKIKDFCTEKGIERLHFENIAAGMNHAEIGAKVAEKWNFPEILVEAIRYHHTPGNASKAFIDIVNTVYMGNIFCHYETGKIQYDQIDKNALLAFGFTSEQQLTKTVELFSAKFMAEEIKK